MKSHILECAIFDMDGTHHPLLIGGNYDSLPWTLELSIHYVPNSFYKKHCWPVNIAILKVSIKNLPVMGDIQNIE